MGVVLGEGPRRRASSMSRFVNSDADADSAEQLPPQPARANHILPTSAGSEQELLYEMDSIRRRPVRPRSENLSRPGGRRKGNNEGTQEIARSSRPETETERKIETKKSQSNGIRSRW